jgi:hypothetical protein
MREGMQCEKKKIENKAQHGLSYYKRPEKGRPLAWTSTYQSLLGGFLSLFECDNRVAEWLGEERL